MGGIFGADDDICVCSLWCYELNMVVGRAERAVEEGAV